MRKAFGAMPDGRTVYQFQLRAQGGISVSIIELGAAITNLRVPDRYRRYADVVLGYDSLQGYLSGAHYFGAVAGRYCNRIAGGRFSLDGRVIQLDRNEGGNHLHGGRGGFHKQQWRGEALGRDSVEFTLHSPEGDQGYPGNLQVSVRYTLLDPFTLDIQFSAATDRPTVVNLTQHTYFNLAGHGSGSIDEHHLQVAGNRYAPIDSTLLPTGKLLPVEGSPLDFTRPAKLGDRLEMEHEQLTLASGFDHSWELSTREFARPAAVLLERSGGRSMTLYTDQPALQVYSGNHLHAEETGKGGVRYGPRAGLCLEAQDFADAPNIPTFPSTCLLPEERYRRRIRWVFGR